MASLERAIAIAAEAHAGQTDKGGAPYILHPIRVMMALTEPVDRIVGVLHDVAEDCPRWPLARLSVAGFPAGVIVALDALTKRPGEPYEDFIERCAADPIARRVKLADLRDNSDMSRITQPTELDWSRLLKYGRAATRLIAQPGISA